MTDDTQDSVAEKAAIARFDLWESMGYPTSPNFMAENKYNVEFKGRMICRNRGIMNEAQRALRVLFCPACITEEGNYGTISATRLYIAVEDDVMTVFKAMGHFQCHNCGFEEFHPMRADPRVDSGAAYNPNLAAPGLYDGLRQQPFGAIGMSPNVSPSNLGAIAAQQQAMAQEDEYKRQKKIYQTRLEMTNAERQALQRIYGKAATEAKRQVLPSDPPGGWEEAERRQLAINKLRAAWKV